MADLSSFSSANRGPLTTIFTPPASCLSQTTLVSYLTSVSSISGTKKFTTTKLFVNHFSWGDSSCYPSTIATIDGATRWGNGYYYSPGICPSGWTSACAQRTILSPSGFTNVLDAATTGVLCCPSSWACVGGTTSLAAHGCSTFLTAGQTISSVWYAPTPTPNVYMSIPTSLAPSELGSFSIKANTSALCDAVPVLWQNTDVQILALLSSTTAATATTSKSSSSTATNTSSSTNSAGPSTGGGGLSGGAKAAIGVVIPLVLIALVLGIFLFMRRRTQASLLREAGNAHELADSGLGNGERYEMGSGMKKDDKHAVVEADAGHGILEMGTGKGKFGDDHYGPGKIGPQEAIIHEMPAGDWERRTDEVIEDKRGSGMSRDQLLPRKPVGGTSRDGSVSVGELSPSLGGVSEITLLEGRSGGG